MASLWVCLKQRLPWGGRGSNGSPAYLQEGRGISQEHLEGLPHLHPLLGQHRGHRHPHGHSPQPHPARPAQEVRARAPHPRGWGFCLFFSSLPSPNIQGCVLGVYRCPGSGDPAMHKTQQNPCSGELPFWWERETIKEKAREYIICWRDTLWNKIGQKGAEVKGVGAVLSRLVGIVHPSNMVAFEQRPRSEGVNFVDAGGKSIPDRRNSPYKGGKQHKDWPGRGAEGN